MKPVKTMFQRIFSKQNRALLRELVITDFKLRYQGSVLGYLWTLLKPLGLFTILYVVFVKFLKFGKIEHYPVYLLLGIVMWNFFAEATNNGMQAIVSRGDLLRKIKFPRYIVVVSGVVSAMVNLIFNLVVVFAFLLINHVHLQSTILWLPLIFIELFIFSLAVAFFLAAAYVKYRDLGHIWEVIMQGAFYATPIIYALNQIPLKWAKLLLLSPVAQIIQDARHSLITKETMTAHNTLPIYWRIVPFIIVVLSIILAGSYFKRSSKYFAENI